MSGYLLKAPGARLDYELDWSALDLSGSEQVAVDLGWTLDPEDAGATPLRVVGQGVDEGRSTVSLDGGVSGATYLITGRVETSLGRVLERSFVVRVGAA